MEYNKLQEELSALLETIDGPFIPQARAYSSSILYNIEVGRAVGSLPERSTVTQLLYVITNLEGASTENINKVDALLRRYGFDLPEAIAEAMGILEEGDEF
jgi:hypothetical protein